MRRFIVIVSVLCCFSAVVWGQREKVKNQPYVDNKLFHLGFHVGIHAQDMLLTHTGVSTNGETWFAEIPTYSPGFSVGVIGDMFLNPYFNLRFIPTINFGDKRFVFREQETGEEFRTSVRSSYLTLPLSVKYSSFRLNNCRPYLTAGVYGAMDLGRKRGNPLYLKGFDYGLEFGIGCNIYLPFFRLCPELKFSFGLPNLLVKDRPDLEGQETIKYTEALSKGTSRMVTLTFNFE